MGPSGLSERALVALRTSKLSKNCASRGLVGPFRRAARAEKDNPGLQGGGGGGRPPPPPPLATCLTGNYYFLLHSIIFKRNQETGIILNRDVSSR